jgi:hypothetical protein
VVATYVLCQEGDKLLTIPYPNDDGDTGAFGHATAVRAGESVRPYAQRQTRKYLAMMIMMTIKQRRLSMPQRRHIRMMMK